MSGHSKKHGFGDQENHEPTTMAELNNLISDDNVAGDGTVVHKTGNESIAGEKTFEDAITLLSNIMTALPGIRNLIATNNGQLQSTSISIEDAPGAGSIFNFLIYDADPDVADLKVGDLWLSRNGGSDLFMKLWDGTQKYSMQLPVE